MYSYTFVYVSIHFKYTCVTNWNKTYANVYVRILQYIFSIINDDFIAKMALYDCQNWLKLRDYSENVEILDKMKI